MKVSSVPCLQFCVFVFFPDFAALPWDPEKEDVGKYDGRACPAIIFSHIFFGHQEP